MFIAGIVIESFPATGFPFTKILFVLPSDDRKTHLPMADVRGCGLLQIV
jgi:hypothetical protein